MAPRRGKLVPVQPPGPELTFKLNPEDIVPAGGVGGWNVVARPRRYPTHEWAGMTEEQISFPLIFDGMRKRISQEGHIRTLERMAKPRRGGKVPPARIKFVYGPPVQPSDRWVVADLAWGDEVRARNLERIYAEVTVTLSRFESTETLSPADKRNASSSGGGKTRRTYVVRNGDTLPSIAAKLLGNASRWKEIAKLNAIRDPRAVKIGQRLKIPEG